MRPILSRKGFDSSSGGCASPILPDGRLLTLPIPSTGGPVRFRDLAHDSVEVGQLVHDLSRGGVTPDDTAHLDPVLPRRPGLVRRIGVQRSVRWARLRPTSRTSSLVRATSSCSSAGSARWSAIAAGGCSGRAVARGPGVRARPCRPPGGVGVGDPHRDAARRLAAGLRSPAATTPRRRPRPKPSPC